MRNQLICLVAALLAAAPAWACRVCRPRVQAGIYTPAYGPTLLVLLLPVALLGLLGLGLYFAPALRRFTKLPLAGL